MEASRWHFGVHLHLQDWDTFIILISTYRSKTHDINLKRTLASIASLNFAQIWFQPAGAQAGGYCWFGWPVSYV
jgi:hypothetical protein